MDHCDDPSTTATDPGGANRPKRDLEDLPPEVWRIIARSLTICDLAALSLASQGVNRTLADRMIWSEPAGWFYVQLWFCEDQALREPFFPMCYRNRRVRLNDVFVRICKNIGWKPAESLLCIVDRRSGMFHAHPVTNDPLIDHRLPDGMTFTIVPRSASPQVWFRRHGDPQLYLDPCAWSRYDRCVATGSKVAMEEARQALPFPVSDAWLFEKGILDYRMRKALLDLLEGAFRRGEISGLDDHLALLQRILGGMVPVATTEEGDTPPEPKPPNPQAKDDATV